MILCLVVAATACDGAGAAGRAPGQGGADAPPTLGELAAAWSAGQDHPRCQDRGPRGEYLGPRGDQYCVWDAPAGRVALGQVGAYTDRRGDPTFLTWERPTAGGSDADRLVDSLGAALTSRGLTARECGGGESPAGTFSAVMWTNSEIEVHLSRITPPTGEPRLVVMAVAAPGSIPAVGCPESE